MGFCVLLDGKPLRTPARADVIVPSKTLAGAVAEEWRTQGETIRADSMPMTRLVNTALDRIAPRRADAIAQMMRFAAHDLVCYRAAHPEDLVARQAAVWDPLVDWIGKQFSCKLEVGTGISHIEQSPKALSALERAVSRMDDFKLAVLHAATTVAGSLVIALAFVEGRLDAEGAFAACQVDDAYQAGRWGRDAEAEKRARRAAGELVAAERFLTHLRKS
ncbi:MAG: ATP12 family chaperone protein [Alphaproteobacteria bacterium]